MTFTEYQALAMRTSRKDISPDEHVFNGILGIAGESGECAALVKKCFYQDGRAIVNHMREELGDLLWYIVETATAMELNLDEIAEGNIEKLRQRYPDGFDPERSLHREK